MAAKSLDDAVRYVARQGARWLYAGEQDKDDVVRFLHFAYAHGYLEIAHRLAGAERTSALIGFDTEMMLERAAAGLDVAQRKLIAERGGLPGWMKPWRGR